jgi:polysaccharide export outer membrane protein
MTQTSSEYRPWAIHWKGGLALLLALSLAGCVKSLTANGLGGPTVTRVDAAELPGPDGQIGSDQGYVYRLGPLDKLVVDVLAIQDPSDRKVTVDGSGQITVPIAGMVKVGGLTLGQATNEIERRLREGHVRFPQVAVNLEEAVSSFVTVDGQVDTPGNYPVLPGMTLVRAVAGAKGATEFARTSEVVIRRKVKGQEMIALYDLNAIRSGNYSDPVIYPGDIVTVGDSPTRRLMQQIIAVAPLLVTPVVAAISPNY